MPKNQTISISGKLKEVGRHSVVYGLGSVVQSAAGLILLPVLTGSLSKNDFGAYSLILMASSIASAIFYFGMTSALPRSFFDYESEEDRRVVFTTAFLVLVVGAILQSMLGWYCADVIASFLIGDSSYAEAVTWAMAGAAVGFVNQYFFGYLRLLRKSIASVVLSATSFLILILLTLYLLDSNPGSLVAAYESILYAQFVILFIFLMVLAKSAFCLKLNVPELSKMLRFGTAIIIASFGNMLLDWTDRLIIERYMGLADVGIYSAVFRVSAVVNIILVFPFVQIWSPMMMEYRNKLGIHELFTHVFSALLIIGGCISAFVAFFGQDFLPILIRSDIGGEEVAVLVIAVVGTLIYGLTNIVAAGLFYERKVNQLSYVYYSIAAIKAMLTILCVQWAGLVGAATSGLIASVLVPVCIYSLSKKYFSFQMEWHRIGRLLVVILPSLLYAAFFAFGFSIPILPRFFCFSMTLLAVYFLCLSFPERRTIFGLFGARTS